MQKWFALFLAVTLVFTISGCNTEDGEVSAKAEATAPTTEQTEPPPPTYDSIEYWDIVEVEIVSMLNQHNLYVSSITHGYPCVGFYVDPGIVTDEGKPVASGLSQEEYAEVLEAVKAELYMILDKYRLAEPKSAFHGCHSTVEFFFNNWFIDEKKIQNNVYSRGVASYGVNLLEYYYNCEEKSYVNREGLFSDVWSKYPVYTP